MRELRPSPVPAASSSLERRAPGRREIEADDAGFGQAPPAAAQITAAKACSTTSAFTEASDRMNTCSGTASRQLSGTSMAPSRAQA